MDSTSNLDRLLEALKNGENLTARQITARFGLANPRAAVSSLRFKGYAVYLNDHKTAKGEISKKYRIGRPSREIVAAGYRWLAEQARSGETA
jgi:predicted transcriptional regulator